MSEIRGLGIGSYRAPRQAAAHAEYILKRQDLARVLAFNRLSIDDVINSPISRNQVIGYYKLTQQIRRRCEIIELEQWWNDIE